MTRARTLSLLGNENNFTVTNTSPNRVGIGSTQPDGKLDVDGDILVGTAITIGKVSGIISATSYRGDGSQLTGVDSSNLIDSGDTNRVAANTSGIVVTGIATVTGNMNVGGVLSYADVTNVDSVGIVTARSGIEFGVSGVGGTITALGHGGFTGIVTALGFQATGVVTAASFRGDGSQLSGVDSSNLVDSGDTNRVAANTSGVVITGIATATEFLQVLGTAGASGKGIEARSNSTQATDTNKAIRVRNNSDTDTFSLSYRGAATFGGDLTIPDYIVHSGDSNTKFGFESGDTFTVETAGSERFRVSSDGNLLQSAGGGETIFEMQRTDANTTGAVGTINFLASDDHSVASIGALGDGDNEGAHIVFRTTSAAANNSPFNAATPERLRITSAGIVTVTSGGSLAIPAVPGANTNADMPVLFQSTTGLIDGGSGLVYNPAEDTLKVNGNHISTQTFRGAGDDVTLSAANSSSTSFFQIDGGVPKISMASDKVIMFSPSIGEVGNVTGFQATNTAASANTDFGIRATTIRFATGSSERCRVTDSGFMPDSDNARDLGSSSLRWANVYSADLQLSNEGSSNDVDGTWGQYTIQEGEDDLFLLNRRNGKTYKFVLQEVN